MNFACFFICAAYKQLFYVLFGFWNWILCLVQSVCIANYTAQALSTLRTAQRQRQFRRELIKSSQCTQQVRLLTYPRPAHSRALSLSSSLSQWALSCRSADYPVYSYASELELIGNRSRSSHSVAHFSALISLALCRICSMHFSAFAFWFVRTHVRAASIAEIANFKSQCWYSIWRAMETRAVTLLQQHQQQLKMMQ